MPLAQDAFRLNKRHERKTGMVMESTTDLAAYGRASTTRARPAAGVTTRDPRLDFYRGIAMLIILAAHTPNNFFSSWIPGRWGFSDATEIFVFCSGMASAIAFGGSFDRRGWFLGTARVAQRVWQVYWAHIALFVATAAMLAAIDLLGGFDKQYIGSLNLWKFFADPAAPLVGLLTLTYVPNYFDILPMYMVILAMLPVVMALARVHVWLVFAVSLAVWLAAQSALLGWFGFRDAGINFSAEPWSTREWFFNPFAWQLIFFTGFFLMRGWIPAPPVRAWLVVLAAAVVIGFVFLSAIGFRLFQWEPVQTAFVAMTGCSETGFGACNPVFDWRQGFAGWYDKTDFGILRYVHFLALAYLAWVVAGPHGRRLRPVGDGAATRVWRGFVAMITKVGQQSLAVFLFSMFFARFSGFVMDQIGRNLWNMTAANLIGFALLIGLAYGVSWFKRQPWKVSATG